MNRRTFIDKIWKPTLFGIFVPSVALSVPPTARLMRGPRTAAAGGGGCTLHSGNLFNESFENTGSPGYDNTVTETGTPDENAALPGTSPCSGLGAQCLNANYLGGAGARQYAEWDRGSSHDLTNYHRGYFYIISSSAVSGDDTTIYSTFEGPAVGANRAVEVEINLLSSQYSVGAVSNSASSAKINISLTTWYRWEIKYVPGNAAGASEFKLFDAANSQIDTTKTFNTSNNFVRYVRFGVNGGDNTNAFRVAIDGIGVDTTGYLGT